MSSTIIALITVGIILACFIVLFMGKYKIIINDDIWNALTWAAKTMLVVQPVLPAFFNAIAVSDATKDIVITISGIVIGLIETLILKSKDNWDIKYETVPEELIDEIEFEDPEE